MHNMVIIATSYEGFVLGMQIPFSLIFALIALILAFKKRARAISVGFAICAVVVTLGNVALEFKNYGLNSFTRADTLGFLCIAFAPSILAVDVLMLNASQTGHPPT